MAGLTWNGDRLLQEFDNASAEGLLRAAILFQTAHKQKLNRSNPRPYLDSSKAGEYPRARTGFGRDSVVYEPTTRGEVAAEGAVRIGYLQSAFYMATLEVFKHRKGLLDTFNEMKSQLAATIGGA